jgi:hypothetical protein
VGTTAAPIDPKLGLLQINGGPTDTMALLATSPAIDAGGPNAPPRDQRHYLRNGPSDIGAFEYQGSLLRLISISRDDLDIVIRVEVVAGQVYRLERKPNITDSTWLSISGLQDLIAAGDDIEQVTDPNAISLGKAFYQVRLLP